MWAGRVYSCEWARIGEGGSSNFVLVSVTAPAGRMWGPHVGEPANRFPSGLNTIVSCISESSMNFRRLAYRSISRVSPCPSRCAYLHLSPRGQPGTPIIVKRMHTRASVPSTRNTALGLTGPSSVMGPRALVLSSADGPHCNNGRCAFASALEGSRGGFLPFCFGAV